MEEGNPFGSKPREIPPGEGLGKCYSCGFLRFWLPLGHTDEYRDVPVSKRLSGDISLYEQIPVEGRHIRPWMVCVLGQANLIAESQEPSPERPYQQKGGDVLFKERKCPKWSAYQMGKPLQQYFMELFMQDLEKLRQQFQRDRERDRQDFDKGLATRDQELQTQRHIDQRRANRLITRITLVGVALTLAEVLTLTKESLLWKLLAKIYHLFR
jgi:hypothetical protein